MRGPLPVLLILLSFAVAACQATTGHLVGKGGIYRVTCEPIPISDVSVNWGVFSTVVEAKNCNADNQYQERYKLANGGGVYQEANADYVYFYEITERSFREALARNKAFAGKAISIKLHYPKLKNRITIFAQTKVSGRNVIHFKMNSGTMNGGGVNEYGWSKLHTGTVYGDGNMSEDDFRQFFLERLRIFDTPGSAK